ncbi:MAG: recombinase family protein [Bacteroidota bacterium]
MSRKGKALETSKRYMFDYEKGEYIEKPEFSDAKAKPYGIIYARVSDPKQVEQGDGIESQIDNAERYAERNNITVLKIFTDEAKTGAKLTREGLLAALAYIKQENRRFPKIGYFLCSEISRLSRSENIGDTTEMVNKISAT